MKDFKPYTCCFTGHRDLPAGEYNKILTRVRYRIDELVSQGYRYFGVGGALGFDTLVTDYLINYKKTNHLISIIEVLPFKGYRDSWTDEQKRHASFIDMRMDKIVYCSDTPSDEAYLSRNRHLVDCSSACISYCTRHTGGTAYTVNYALKDKIPVYNASSFDIKSLIK